MKVSVLLTIIITFTFLLGIWQFIWLHLSTKSYNILNENDETFFDFCCRVYENDWIWSFRKKLHLRWFYNSKAFRYFTILKGVVLVLISVGLLILFLFIGQTDYKVFFDISI